MAAMQWITVFVASALLCLVVRALAARDYPSVFQKVFGDGDAAVVAETAVYVAAAVAAALVLWEAAQRRGGAPSSYDGA